MFNATIYKLIELNLNISLRIVNYFTLKTITEQNFPFFSVIVFQQFV